MYRAINRRQLITASAALGATMGLASPAVAADAIYLGDMHFHGRFDPRTLAFQGPPLQQTLAEGPTALLVWTFSADLPWLEVTPDGIKQKSVPSPGAEFSWFQRRTARIKAHLAEQNIKVVADRDDIARALAGEPHVVLATEGSNYLESDLSRVATAYDVGIRHLQLVHYSRNTVGDFQTKPPEHQGLSAFGKQVVAECNRLGILVDLAHSSEAAIAQALDISKAPVVFSHGSIAKSGTPNWTMLARRARQISLANAKRIAQKGGVVGLWGLRTDIGTSIESYADRLAEMVDLIGEDHVGIGTDINGMGAAALLTGHAQLHQVVAYWQKKRMPERRIRKIAIENYARVLKDVFAQRTA